MPKREADKVKYKKLDMPVFVRESPDSLLFSAKRFFDVVGSD